MAKKEKVVDLKPTSITEKQLEDLQAVEKSSRFSRQHKQSATRNRCYGVKKTRNDASHRWTKR